MTSEQDCRERSPSEDPGANKEKARQRRLGIEKIENLGLKTAMVLSRQSVRRTNPWQRASLNENSRLFIAINNSSYHLSSSNSAPTRLE